MDKENLGPAERIIQSALTYADHMYHNRPGIVTADPTTATKAKWAPVTYKEEDGKKVVYRLDKVGKKTNRVKLGELWNDNTVRTEDRRKVGDYRQPGLFPEVATWMYNQVAEVWKYDNEVAARWASYAFVQEHRDLKVVLAAFMLVQSRKGDPERDDDGTILYDEDYRDVGEAMVLLLRKDKRHLDAKLLLRVRQLLSLPGVQKINQELGFGKSTRRPFLGRWPQAVRRWLRYREQNLPMLEGLVKNGQSKMVIQLAKGSRYQPLSPKFFEVLGWQQKQAADGHRTIAIDQAITKNSESWDGLTEEQICEKIVQEKPNFKRIVGRLPQGMGLTRAIMAASIEAGGLSNQDLVIQAPTLEDLGLLKVQEIREKWERALKQLDNQRAAHIALRMKTKEAAEKLNDAAETAVKKAVEEKVKNLCLYVIVDVSGSMGHAITRAKALLQKILVAFPIDQTVVIVFNTAGRLIKLKSATGKGVEQAFRGIQASGGTDHASAIRTAQASPPKEGEDAMILWVGDEGQYGDFAQSVRASGINPMAFGLVKVGHGGSIIQDTARQLEIPCFMVDEAIFNDAYAVPRTLRDLAAATPVGQPVGGRAPARVSLIDQIINTELLVKPTWASAA